jgi:hypothetical protein
VCREREAVAKLGGRECFENEARKKDKADICRTETSCSFCFGGVDRDTESTATSRRHTLDHCATFHFHVSGISKSNIQ